MYLNPSSIINGLNFVTNIQHKSHWHIIWHTECECEFKTFIITCSVIIKERQEPRLSSTQYSIHHQKKNKDGLSSSIECFNEIRFVWKVSSKNFIQKKELSEWLTRMNYILIHVLCVGNGFVQPDPNLLRKGPILYQIVPGEWVIFKFSFWHGSSFTLTFYVH